MTESEQQLPNNCLLKKTKEIFEINLFQDTLKKFDISGKCFLVVDYRGSLLINNFMSMSEVLSKGIISIDSLYKKRRPYKEYSAIYLISGKKNSLEKIINEDFPDEENRLYKYCHLFIIDEITNELYDYMAEKQFLKYIKSLKQIYVKYVTIDKNLFSYGNDINFNSIYNIFEDDDKINKMNVLRLLNVCKALNVYPNVLYFNADKKCKFLAEKVNEELKINFSKRKKDGILLITSRFIDFSAPFQYSLIYQNLLLEYFKNKKVKYCNQISLNNKSYILDYKDELYNKYKYMIVFEMMNKVNDDLKEFRNSSEAKAIDNINKDVAEAAQKIGKYQKTVKNISEHIDLGTELKKVMNNRHILDLLELQNTIISKINIKGKKVSEKDIIKLLKQNKTNFKKDDSMRLIFLIKYNYPDIDIDKICNILNINLSKDDKNIINILNKVNNYVDLKKLNELDKCIISYRDKTNYDKKEKEKNKGDKRYIYSKESKLTTICDMCCKNTLPDNIFSFVEKQELKTQKRKFISNFDGLISDKNEDETKQNLILFNLGGLSNYEVSSLEKWDSIGQYNVNLILGSNKVYNSEEYIEELNDYINGRNTFIKIEEKNIFKEKENEDEKIDISYTEKGSKEKMKKRGKSNSDNSFEEDMK